MNANRNKLQAPAALILTIAAGVIMLLTYVLPALRGTRAFILNLVMIGAAAALVIGVFNLIGVHARKIQEGDNPAGSLVLVLALIITFFVTVLEDLVLYPAWLPNSEWLLANIQVPVESALMGVLAVTLVYAAARLITQRPTIFSAVFVLTVLVTLAVSTQVGVDSGLGQSIRAFISHGLALGGARGILIGVALGTLATGLRILMGTDRPYGG